MESVESSLLTSLTGELKSDDYIQPHYKECYRLAIDRLVSGGSDKYQEFLKGERIGSFLSEEELLFITENAEQFRSQNDAEEINDPADTESSSGTYWPVHSDVETPDLDLGWPDILNEHLQTNIDLLFHPARQNSPTIKEVVRKRIQEARQVIAIVMDIFTDIDIFKEVVDASIRGVPVYVLLNDFHLKSFLKMAENQDVKIQQLRNMRVRTVKGQDYFCRSGAKFHGAMEQRFLLVDCHTTIFGSYSFTWSFEKINLSMVQVITGHLVKTFDEEFRTLYARSTVPPDLCPVEGLYQRNGPQGRQILPKSHSGQIERKDQLRHTLDTVYRKTCERKLGARDFEERRYDEDPNKHGPLIQNGIGVHNRMTQLQSTEAMDYLKRHSYAGERQDEYVPQNMRPRASNWNISREAVNSTNNYHTNNYLQGPQVFRGQNVRQSYNGKDKEVMAVQQNMPTLENTSKSFMRTLRIESYLKNPDGPYGDSCDYLDQFESQDKASCYMQRGMRSSYVFRSTKPEQMEPNRHINNSSTCFTSSAGPNTPMHYSSMQWNPKGAPENRLNSEEFMLKRPSLQMLDGNHCNKSYGSGRNSYQSAYTSLDRAQSGNMIPKPESLTDSWYKRHSVADPRSNTHESSGHVYGSLTRMQINRSTAGISTQNGGYKPNLNEDQRSVSHYDVKSIPSTKSPSTSSWKDPTSMTVSTAFQEVKSQDSTAKSRSSQHFIDKSSNKIKSIFNIPVKKGDSMQSLETLSLKSGTSTDTITAEDEVTMSGGGEKTHQTSTDSVRSSSEHQRSQTKDDHQKSSKPRFRAEERRIPLQISLPRITTHKKPSILDKSTRPGLDTQSWSKSRSTENRLYSRFEPFCSLEKKQSPLSGHSSYSQDKPGSLSRGGAGIEHNVSRTVRGHHENKLEKFFHRVGNLIHKNK